MAHHDIVALAKMALAVARRHQIERHRSTRGKYHLLAMLRTDKCTNNLASLLILGGHLLRKQMDTAMDIGIVVEEQLRHLIYHTPRFLCSGGAIEVYQLAAIYLALQNRKLGSYSFDIKHTTHSISFAKPHATTLQEAQHCSGRQPRPQSPRASNAQPPTAVCLADAYSRWPARRADQR